jgi:hypothetical protein
VVISKGKTVPIKLNQCHPILSHERRAAPSAVCYTV